MMVREQGAEFLVESVGVIHVQLSAEAPPREGKEKNARVRLQESLDDVLGDVLDHLGDEIFAQRARSLETVKIDGEFIDVD